MWTRDEFDPLINEAIRCDRSIGAQVPLFYRGPFCDSVLKINVMWQPFVGYQTTTKKQSFPLKATLILKMMMALPLG